MTPFGYTVLGFGSGGGWDPAGTHYYNIDNVSTGVDYYKLSTPFDLANKGTVITNIGSGARVDVMDISNDGTNFFTAGDAGTSTMLRVYELSTPYDLSSATEISNSTTALVLSNPPTCFEFGKNGSRFWYVEFNVMKQYDLATAYDITSTKTLSGSITTTQGNGAGDPAFSPDGLKLTFGHRGIHILETGTLTTAYDISTYTQTHTFTTSDNDPSCAKWNADGTKLFVRHASPDMVNEYGTTTPYSVQGLSLTTQIFNNTAFAGGGHEFNYAY